MAGLILSNWYARSFTKVPNGAGTKGAVFIERNELCRIAHETIAGYFDKDPPAFYQVPFGYHDHDEIRRVLVEARFRELDQRACFLRRGACRIEL